MSYPENPETIVLKNKFYPKGLKEIDVWNYYHKVRANLLREVQGRDLMFFIFTDLNNPIIKRKGTKSNFIRLNGSNYDQMITGRTVSIHSAMNRSEDIAIVDIDLHPSDGFHWARTVTSDVYEFIMDKMPVVRRVNIRFTGRSSFHILCKLPRRLHIDSIRMIFQQAFENSDLSKRYTIGGKRSAGIPNIDLGRNVFRANFITLHSLSILGLRCMEVPYNKLMSFDPHRARI